MHSLDPTAVYGMGVPNFPRRVLKVNGLMIEQHCYCNYEAEFIFVTQHKILAPFHNFLNELSNIPIWLNHTDKIPFFTFFNVSISNVNRSTENNTASIHQPISCYAYIVSL